MSVLANMMLGAKDQPGERLGMTLIAPRRVAAREREIHERALEMLDLIRLRHLADDYAGTLSGGQRKLLELGGAWRPDPGMFFFDEPRPESLRCSRSSSCSTSRICAPS